MYLIVTIYASSRLILYHQASFLFQDVDLCQYGGKVRDKPNSWVAISTCDGLTGVIYDGEEMHYIEKGVGYDGDIESSHYLYRHSDLVVTNKTCGYGGDADDHKHAHEDNRILRVRILKRINLYRIIVMDFC